MGKRTTLGNAIMHKCPKCQESDLFSKPFKYTDPLAMPRACPTCGQFFNPEPGYYFGAMFLSYILTAFFYLGVEGICLLVLNMSVSASLIVLVVVAALTYFFFLRFSRSLWINLMVRFDPNASAKYKASLEKK